MRWKSPYLAFVIGSVCLAPVALAGTLSPAAYLPGLPANATVTGAATDATGNLFLSGTLQSSSPDAFIAKFSPAGDRLYFTVLAGKSADRGGPIAVDAAGNAYITGATDSPDFPTTPGALQQAADGLSGGFIAKIDAQGKIVFSTLYHAGPDQSTNARDIAVGPTGDVFVTGQSVGHSFVTTPGTPAPANPLNVFFVFRLSANGTRAVYAAGGGIGGARITVDAANNAYVQGFTLISDGSEVPITPNAYQKTFPFTICGGTRAFGFPCAHQHIAKLNPEGKLIFCTFLTGAIQDQPAGIAVDARGDIYVAGTTSSKDYPVTEDALQKENRVDLPPTFPRDFFLYGFSLPQPQTGYLSKLSADGTRLLYSTYLGGTRIDSISALAWTGPDQLTLLAAVQSPGFPGLPAVPERCLPARTRDMPVTVQFNTEKMTLGETTLITGADAPYLLTANATVVSSGPFLAPAGTTATDSITCLIDAADYAPAAAVSPGQLVTLLGTSLGPADPVVYKESEPVLPTAIEGTMVLVNGTPAPLIYAATDQINFVIPYEAAGEPTATVKVITAAGTTAQRTVRIVSRNPTISTGGITEFPLCGGMTPTGSVAAAVLNEDFSPNTCQNPAKAGAKVHLFLNGTGINHPGNSGDNPGAGVPLEAKVAETGGNQVESVESVPWAPLGVWDITVRVKADPQGFNLLNFTVNGERLRKPGGIAVWVRP